MATLAIASVATAQVSPAPTARSDASRFFAQPFEYTVPATIDPAATMSETSVLWALAEGIPDTAPPYGSVQSDARETGARGVLVADVTQAFAHPCPGVDGGRSRVEVGDGPTAFVDDMQTIAGLALKDVSEATLDSRPATAARSGRKSKCETADIHLPGFATPDRIELGVPSRIIVTDVAGSTIMVQAWAGTREALEAWLPIADEFIDSIHFVAPVGAGSASARPSILPIATVSAPQESPAPTTWSDIASDFVRPFEYTIPQLEPTTVTEKLR